MTNDDLATSATRTNGQTGPRTEAGKAKSSRNSLRTGLYAARDFVRPEEEEEYAQTLIKLMDELVPDNSIEQTFATEIMGATWRLRRCRLIEEHFCIIPNLDFDPMLDERTEKQQKSVDRARSQSHLILRRSLDELRKLQKVRIILTNDDLATSATRTNGQTGPRTEAGKAKSSRNSLRTGLYAARDFVRPEEEEEYAQTLIKLMDELVPDNSIEQTFATEIMGATWRLRRCRLIEEHFCIIPNLDFDPMLDERTEKQQKSVDRARSQSHLILRRSLDELRKLQKVRIIPEQIADQLPKSKPAPTSNACPVNMDALMAVSETQLADRFHETGLDSFCNAPTPAAPAAASFCKPAATPPPVTKNIPRNAPCPCKSGAKYKKCCGGPAAQAVKPAA